jgi:HK97 family phage portal protein
MFGGILTKALGDALGYWRTGPAKLTDPILPQWLAHGRSYAGKRVTVDSALQIGAVMACVGVISDAVSTLPCNVYINGDDGRRLARDHPLSMLLHDAPNADQTAPELFQMLCAGLLLWGNAYAEIERILGRVVALTPLPPSLVSIRRDDSGALVYTFNAPGQNPREIPEDDILHIRGFTLDGILGLSPISQAAQSLGIALAAEEAAGALFANGMRSSGYVAAPTVLNKGLRDEAETLLARFRGAANAGKVPILEAGWKFEPFSINPQDAELLATREFQVAEICRWFRVPPHMIGHMDKSTSWGTGLEQQMLGFLTLTLRPWLKRIEAAVKRKLVAPAERGRLEIEFNVAGLLRADSAARAAYFVAMVQNGIYSRDEIRGLENMPKRGGLADSLTVQAQNIPIDLAGGPASLSPPGASPAQSPVQSPSQPAPPASAATEAAP